MLTVNRLATRRAALALVVRYYVRIGLIQPVSQQEEEKLRTPIKLFATRQS